jgi:hypothetical protein
MKSNNHHFEMVPKETIIKHDLYLLDIFVGGSGN